MQFVVSDWAAVPNVHRFAHQAMATTFEAVIQYEDRTYAQQAARAAFDEVDRRRASGAVLETSDVTRSTCRRTAILSLTRSVSEDR
jgi:hypothetical protein